MRRCVASVHTDRDWRRLGRNYDKRAELNICMKRSECDLSVKIPTTNAAILGFVCTFLLVIFGKAQLCLKYRTKIFTHTFKRSRLKLIVCATFLSILVMPKIVKKKILIICAKSSYFFSNMLKSHLHLVG